MKQFNNHGFTFIELILYISIVTIMLSAIVPFGWNVVKSSVKSSVEQEVYSQARYVSERIKYEIRNASGITTVSSNSISLTNFSPDTTTVIDLSAGKIRINKNGTGATNLNSNDTTASSLTFTNYTSGNNTKNIGFSFSVASNLGALQQYQESVSIRGDAELRSN